MEKTVKQFDLQLIAAQTICHDNGRFSKHLYEWANKFNIDLTLNGQTLSNINNFRSLLSDVLNDEFKLVKPLLK